LSASRLYPTSKKFSCEITGFIAGNCVLYYFNSEFTKLINKTNKNANIFVIFLGLFVILLIFFSKIKYMTSKIDKILSMQQWLECVLDTFCILRSLTIDVIYFAFVWGSRSQSTTIKTDVA
jgi:hypothetical protein